MGEFLSQLGSSVEQIVFVVGDLPNYRLASKMPLDSRIHIVYQHEAINPFRRPPRFDRASLASFEERYGAPSLWRYIIAERIISWLSYEEKLGYLQAYLEYFESLCRQHRPEVFITGPPDALTFMVALDVFKRNGVMPLVVNPGRIPGRVFVGDGYLEQIPFLGEAYDGLKGRALASSEGHTALDMRNAYRIRRARPSYYSVGKRVKLSPSLRRIATALHDHLNNGGEYFDYRLRDAAYLSVAVRLRTPVQEQLLRRVTRSTLPHQKYFYFPLHFEPEAALLVMSTYSRDQHRVIEQIASALPAGHVLCVKEHPSMFPGSRPLGYYNRLARLGPVQILSQSIDSYDVIARSQGVITIAGTSGWEALFYGKPVLLFGRAFYEVFQEGVFRAGGFMQVAETLRRMATFSGFSDAAFDKFVLAVVERTYPGDFDLASSSTHDPRNIRAIADALVAEIRFRLRRRYPCPAR